MGKKPPLKKIKAANAAAARREVKRNRAKDLRTLQEITAEAKENESAALERKREAIFTNGL